eukprot:superscaffoldBa00002455_g14292
MAVLLPPQLLAKTAASLTRGLFLMSLSPIWISGPPHPLEDCSAVEINKVQMTAATFVWMSQAIAINSGCSMCTTQVRHRHLWLGLSSLKVKEQSTASASTHLPPHHEPSLSALLLSGAHGSFQEVRLAVHLSRRVGPIGPLCNVQWLAHWTCDAICRSYQAVECAPPVGLSAHSSRGITSSMALFRGVLVEDICLAASWSSTSTFVQSNLLILCLIQCLVQRLRGPRLEQTEVFFDNVQFCWHCCSRCETLRQAVLSHWTAVVSLLWLVTD